MTKTKQEILDIIEDVCETVGCDNFDSIMLFLKPQNSDKMITFADAELHIMFEICEALFMYIYSEIKLEMGDNSSLLKVLIKIHSIIEKAKIDAANEVFGANAVSEYSYYVTQKNIELTNELTIPDDYTKH